MKVEQINNYVGIKSKNGMFEINWQTISKFKGEVSVSVQLSFTEGKLEDKRFKRASVFVKGKYRKSLVHGSPHLKPNELKDTVIYYGKPEDAIEGETEIIIAPNGTKWLYQTTLDI